MYALSGDIVKVNLSVAVPKAFRDSYCLGAATEDVVTTFKRVMLFDETRKSVMALTPYRALASTISAQDGHWIPNTQSGLVEIPKATWDQRLHALQANPGKVSITRTGFTMEGSTTTTQQQEWSGKLQDACWAPLMTGFMTNPDTLWVPGNLAALEPPINSLCVMETELEIIRAEFAWFINKTTSNNEDDELKEPQRIVQCFGGLGGLWTEGDSTAELVGGGKYYSPMYAASKPGAILFLAKKEDEATTTAAKDDEKEETKEGETAAATTEPTEKKRKVDEL